MQRKRVGIVLFGDIEVLDFCGPFEVFSTTRLAEENRRESLSPFEVLLVAEGVGPVTATGGMQVLPHYDFAGCPPLDIVVVPGGWGTRSELHNPVMLDWLRARAADAETVASVCTGAMLLGFAGLLEGLHATTHWRSLDWMRESFPSVTVELRQTFRAGRAGVHLCRHFRGDRHVAESGGAPLRRGGCQGNRPAHGISLSGQRCPPYPPLRGRRLAAHPATAWAGRTKAQYPESLTGSIVAVLPLCRFLTITSNHRGSSHESDTVPAHHGVCLVAALPGGRALGIRPIGQAQHPGDLGRRYRWLQHQRLQPRRHGLQDTQHRQPGP